MIGLAELRRSRGLTQREVADAMGIGQPRICRIESTGFERLSVETVHRYVAACGGVVHVDAAFPPEVLCRCPVPCPTPSRRLF